MRVGFCGMGLLNELVQEMIPRFADGRLVGNRINNEGCAIVVPRDHLIELIFGIVQCVRIFPLDSPVNRYFSPDHDSHLVSHAQHGFVVRIMRQPYKVASKFLGPTKQRACIIFTPRPTRASRSFFMDINSPQENRLAVEQNIRASCFNRTKSDPIIYLVGITCYFNVVQLGIFGRPECQVRIESKLNMAFGIRLECLTDSSLRNANGYFLLELRAVESTN